MPDPDLKKMTVEQAAVHFAGNYLKWEHFVFFGQKDLDRPGDWAIVHVETAQDGLTGIANSRIYRTHLDPYLEGGNLLAYSSSFMGDADFFRGYVIKVYNKARVPTQVFRVFFGLRRKELRETVLDDGVLSELEFGAAIENIEEVGGDYAKKKGLNEAWAHSAYEVLSRKHGGLESCDDKGFYPDEEELKHVIRTLAPKKRKKK